MRGEGGRRRIKVKVALECRARGGQQAGRRGRVDEDTFVVLLLHCRAAPAQRCRGGARSVGRVQLHLRLCGRHRLVQRVVVLRDRQSRLRRRIVAAEKDQLSCEADFGVPAMAPGAGSSHVFVAGLGFRGQLKPVALELSRHNAQVSSQRLA